MLVRRRRWCPSSLMMHATTEVHPVFSEAPLFGSSRHAPPKNCFGEKMKLMLPDEKKNHRLV